MSQYGVVRTDRMFGTDNRAGLVSVKYMGAGTTATAIENGNVVKLDGMISPETNVYEREIFKGVTPAAGDALEDLVLIASPEVLYDERKKDLAEFRNEAGDICRGYRFHSGDIFSVTADALDGTAEYGSAIEVQAGTKLKAAASATSGSTQVGTCIGVETVGKYTYYAILVA
jgi:hypothetical protein